MMICDKEGMISEDENSEIESIVDELLTLFDEAFDDESPSNMCQVNALATYLNGYLYGSNDTYQKIADHNPDVAVEFVETAALNQPLMVVPGAPLIRHNTLPALFIGPIIKWILKKLGKKAAAKALKKWLKKRLKQWIKAWSKEGWKGLWGKIKKKLPGWIIELFGATIILALLEALIKDEDKSLNDKQKKKLKWIKEQLEKGNITPKDAAGMIENLLNDGG